MYLMSSFSNGKLICLPLQLPDQRGGIFQMNDIIYTFLCAYLYFVPTVRSKLIEKKQKGEHFKKSTCSMDLMCSNGMFELVCPQFQDATQIVM